MPAFLTCSIELNLHQKSLEAGIKITVLCLKMLLRFSTLPWMICIWKSIGIADWIIFVEYWIFMSHFYLILFEQSVFMLTSWREGLAILIQYTWRYIYNWYFQMISWTNKLLVIGSWVLLSFCSLLVLLANKGHAIINSWYICLFIMYTMAWEGK